MTEPQFIPNTVGECILDHLPQGTVVLANAVLKFCKLDEIVNSLSIVRERDHHDGILIVVLWRIETKDIGGLLDKG